MVVDFVLEYNAVARRGNVNLNGLFGMGPVKKNEKKDSNASRRVVKTNTNRFANVSFLPLISPVFTQF